ncbi:MAG: CPBP family intramembrane metalloprotease [bacterium]|nr:CPBP family intramembrane metalloprotease [bacterium]
MTTSDTRIKGLVTRNPILVFVGLTFGISWLSAFLSHPLAGLPDVLAKFFGYLAKFGPSLAALIVFALRGGAAAVKRFLAQLLDWRVKPYWFLLVLFGPFAIWVLAAFLRFSTGDLTPEFELAGLASFAPLLLKHVFLGGGLGEELGWRGLLLPELQATRSALSAALLVGLIWGIWHFPAFLLPSSGKDGASLSTIGLFTLLTIALSVIFTWVFNSTRGSLLLVVLLHGAFNAGENSLKMGIPILQGDAMATLLYGGMILTLAVLLISIAGSRRLTRVLANAREPAD